MYKFILKSLGCKQNQLEGDIVENKLLEMGFIKTNKIQEADIYILNSCTVTSHTDSSQNYLLNKAKRDNPKVKTVLMGCLAQTYKNHKDFNYSNIDLILGNTEKLNIEKYINNVFIENTDNFYVSDIFKQEKFENKFLFNPKNTRVNIKIQDGCNNRCAYCIIPYARGKSRSNSIENIIKEIEIVASKGIKEIVLTGIHIGQWGLDFNKKFIDLIKEIEKTNISRYRLGSLYINELDDELIEFLSKSKKFCPHFHLSLQSMCDKTLKNMERNYTVDEAINVIEKLHKNFNLPFLGCDIIVGFPFETDEDFKITYDNLKSLKLSSIHCFPYSKRENTKAYFMKNQVQNIVKTKRVQIITELSNQLHRDFLDRNKNKKAEILIQKKDPKTGLYSAITRNYIKIKFKSDKNDLRHQLKIVELKNYDLM